MPAPGPSRLWRTDQSLAPRRTLAAVGIFGVMVVGFWIAYRIQMVVV